MNKEVIMIGKIQKIKYAHTKIDQFWPTLKKKTKHIRITQIKLRLKSLIRECIYFLRKRIQPLSNPENT